MGRRPLIVSFTFHSHLEGSHTPATPHNDTQVLIYDHIARTPRIDASSHTVHVA